MSVEIITQEVCSALDQIDPSELVIDISPKQCQRIKWKATLFYCFLNFHNGNGLKRVFSLIRSDIDATIFRETLRIYIGQIDEKTHGRFLSSTKRYKSDFNRTFSSYGPISKDLIIEIRDILGL
jgi:hypothetical protein